MPAGVPRRIGPIAQALPARSTFGARGFGHVTTLVAWVAVVIGFTIATTSGSLRVDALASSPHKIEQGKVWYLLTSGLLVQHPIIISLASFIALAGLVLVVCGARIFWIAAVVGHIASTVFAYSAIATARAFDPHSFQALISRPDYGVSAISAAWLGAVATAGWNHRGQTTRGRIAIVLAVLAISAFAYTLRRGITILDSDHLIAFLIGVALVLASTRRRVASAP